MYLKKNEMEKIKFFLKKKLSFLEKKYLIPIEYLIVILFGSLF